MTKAELRVVVDTNVIISAALSPGGTPRRALDTARQQGVLLFSDATFEEVATRVLRPKFDRYVSRQARQELLLMLEQVGVFLTDVEGRIEASRDPDDNKFLELAIAGQADYIVSGDGDLLELHPFQGIPILSPAEFLEVLKD